MSTIVTRSGKGSPLTNTEVDSNFQNLNTDKAELSGAVFTGAITTNSTIDGRDVATDGTKLDGVEASADVTDTANVTAAGALMDSELTSIASVKALNQGVATGDSPTFAALTSTGEITANGGIALGDGDIATFGNSDDLQIYHDGSNSYINESGTGSLYVKATNLTLGDAAGEQYVVAYSGGSVNLYHDNAQKLATTATGIDVTGTATMDGLTLNHNTGMYGTDKTLSSYSASNGVYLNGNANGWLQLSGDGSRNTRINIFGDGNSGVNQITFHTNNVHSMTLGAGGIIFNESGIDRDFRVESDNFTHAFFVQGSDGNVGLNTAPSAQFHVNSTSTGEPAAYFYSNASKSVPCVQIYQDGAGASGSALLVRNDGTGYAIQVDNISAGNKIFTIDNTGSVIFTPITNGHAVFNEGGVDADFRVESDGNANMLFVDGGNNHVGMGTATLNRSGLGADHICLTVGADTQMGMLELQGTRTSNADLGRVSFLNAGTRRAEIVAARIDADNSTKLYFQTSNAGSLGTRLTIGKDGAATFNSTITANVARTSSSSAVVLTLKDNVTGAQTDGVYKAIRSESNGTSSVSEIRFIETDGTNNNTAIGFATSASAGLISEKVRIHPAGVASFSNGIELGSGLDATAANTLDDYEEGNWTPAIVGGTQTIATIQQARYTKIGRSVTLNVYCNQSTVTNSVGLVISGMPFTASSYNATGIVNFSTNSSGSPVLCRTVPNSASLNFYKCDVNQVSIIQTQNAGHLIFSITYTTDQ